MEFWEFTVRWVIWVVINVSLLYSAFQLCAAWAPWRHSERVTAAGVLVLTGLIAVETMCGVFNHLDFISVAGGLCMLIAFMRVVGRSGPVAPPEAECSRLRPPLPVGRPLRVLWLFLILATIVHMGSRVVLALLPPPSNWDSVWYHLPTAVEWLQSKSLWVRSELPYWFYPRNAELLLAWLLIPFHSDLLANLYNFPILIWLGYSVWRLAEAMTIAEEWRWLLVLALPNMDGVTSVMLGTQKNDLLVAALFMSGLVPLFGFSERPGDNKIRLGLSALACGLLIGTKLNGLAYALIILLFLLAIHRPYERTAPLLWRSLIYYSAGLFLSLFWFIKNWLYTGQPLWVVDPNAPAEQTQQALSSSVLSALPSWDVLRALLVDLVRGAGWWPILGLIAAGVLLLGSPGRTGWPSCSRTRGVALITITCFVVFLSTPLTRLVTAGHSIVRLGFPFIILSLLSLFALVHGLTVTGPPRRRDLLQIGLAALILAPSGMPGELFHRLFVSPRGVATMALFGLALGVLAIGPRGRRLWTRAIWAVAALLVVLSPGLLWKLQHLRADRWGKACAAVWNINGEQSGIFRWIETVDDAKIAVYGSQIYYPFYGPRWEHQLRALSGINDPNLWLQRLDQAEADIVVFYKSKVVNPAGLEKTVWPRERAWLLGEPAAAFKFELVYADPIAEAWRHKNPTESMSDPDPYVRLWDGPNDGLGKGAPHGEDKR